MADEPTRRLMSTCHPERRAVGRQLCHTCYYRHRDRGTLSDFALVRRSADDFLDDYALLHAQGYTLRQISARMGMTVGAVRRARARARNRGDRRAFGG
jgi:hypothetical protein